MSAKACRCSRTGSLSLDLPVAGRRFRDERVEKLLGDARDVVHRALESSFMDSRRLVEATQLAHELKRRCLDLLFRRRRLEIEECFDISTHAAPRKERLHREAPS